MIYVDILGVLVILLLICGIVKIARGNRYARMTSEEFEAEAKRTSLSGAFMIGLQKAVDPGHRIDYVMEEKQQFEAESAESGDRPKTGVRISPEESPKE